VATHRDAARARRPGGRFVFGEAVTAIDAHQRGVKRRLQAQFQPHFVATLAVFRQQVQHRRRHAVGPRTDRQAHHVRRGQRVVIQRAQFIHMRIGVGVGLEIGDEAARAGAFCNAAARAVELHCERHRVTCARGKGFVIAEGAATDSLAAIAIGAGKAGVERDLVHPLAMPLQHGAAKGMDAVGEDAHAAATVTRSGLIPVNK
jgi:hypothetical protein